MLTMDVVTSFLGWCTVINFGFLLVMSVAIILLRKPIAKIHAGMFGLSEEMVSHEYFSYLANYKIAVMVFNFIPYVALRLMA
jgi:hypothetical protein